MNISDFLVPIQFTPKTKDNAVEAVVIIIDAHLKILDRKIIHSLDLDQEISSNIIRVFITFQTLAILIPVLDMIKIINIKTHMKIFNITLATENGHIKALTVKIPDHMIAPIVVTFTVSARKIFSKIMITLLDQHHNSDKIEQDSIQIQNLINTHQILPLNPLKTQTETLL